MGCHFLLQGVFPTQGLNSGLPHCRQTLYSLSHQGIPAHSRPSILILHMNKWKEWINCFSDGMLSSQYLSWHLIVTKFYKEGSQGLTILPQSCSDPHRVSRPVLGCCLDFPSLENSITDTCIFRYVHIYTSTCTWVKKASSAMEPRWWCKCALYLYLHVNYAHPPRSNVQLGAFRCCHQSPSKLLRHRT